MEVLEFENVTFAVNEPARTIRGLVVPWSAISTPKGGKRYRFARDSIKAVAAKFIKFFEDHSPAKQFGRAVDMQETDAGLEMTFRVNSGEHGDRMLALAKSGVKTGLSVGVEFDESDTQPDPDNPDAFLVKLANLYEVSLVEQPSFDNSRVITVMASANIEGVDMTTETTEAVETATEKEAVKAEFSAPPGYALVPEAMLASVGATQIPAVIEPRPVAQVTEPANYRFDAEGNLQPAKHDFGVDMIQALNRNLYDPDETPKARKRAQEFINANFDVVRTNVDELSPNIQVPRYVDQKDFRSPVFDAVNKGKVPNGIQPFTWPAYSSSSGLVAAGTEGTEPSSGAYVTTSQTVTPTTLRGKAKISREVWDIGGTPGIGNLVWTQMKRGYQEALEANVIATLDAASPTSLGSLTAGGGTNKQTLVSELVAGLSALQFARGGFSMRYLFAQIDLYQALVAAKDSDLRPYFPAIGPTNTHGTVGNLFGALDVNGVLVIPTWALAATGSVAASSYLIDPLNVDAWADAPRQLLIDDTEVSNVYIGVWGYAASAINDVTGVREVIYDPVP